MKSQKKFKLKAQVEEQRALKFSQTTTTEEEQTTAEEEQTTTIEEEQTTTASAPVSTTICNFFSFMVETGKCKNLISFNWF